MSTRLKKMFIFLIADIGLTALAMISSFLLRFDGKIPEIYTPNIFYYIGISIVSTIPLLFWKKLYSFAWTFVSLSELVALVQVAAISAFVFSGIYFWFQNHPLFFGFPRSIIIIHHTLLFLFLGGLRFAKRIALLLFYSYQENERNKNTLIIGADANADELIRGLQKNKISHSGNGYTLVGILDNRSEKQGTLLHGIKVLGPIKLLLKTVKEYHIETVIIALSQDESDTIPKVVALARKAKVTDVKIIPTIYEVLNGKLNLENIRPIQVEDLLGRKPAKIATEEIEIFLKDKNILVTGAAGSIGSELCRQISRFFPRFLYLLDYEESNLFDLTRMLEIEYSLLSIKPLIADIRNQYKIERLIKELKPHIIFHAAAYKHVPLMEEFPEEAIMTNVFGTLWLAKAALKAGVQKFILISTDKAVRPVSVMGKTKKLAEMIATSFNGKQSTQFISVRFGNVLGSRGSVLPIFEEQLKHRLPLTITHPKMTRFFMTAPEAALLVLEAAASGKGGEIFLLDMGKPVKIVELARELVRLSGLEPDRDIPIVYTKPRPGEKIAEEVLTKEEEVIATRYQKIFRTKTNHNIKDTELIPKIEHLKDAFHDPQTLRRELTKLVR